MENFEEIHFVNDLDNMRAVAKNGNEAKYMDVVSGSNGMTICQQLTGCPIAQLMAQFSIF